MARKPPNRARRSFVPSQRRTATREPAKLFLIVTEGEKTEPNYLRALRDRLGMERKTVEIHHPDATDPWNLYVRAKERAEERAHASRRGGDPEYDQVWVVFDWEKPHDPRIPGARKAIKAGEAVGFHFADSKPCFEFWLLLHFDYTTSPFAACDEAAKRLKKWWSGYSKGAVTSEAILDLVPIAVRNAKSCRKHHEDCDGDGRGNPSSYVDLLIRALNTEAPENHRIDFGDAPDEELGPDSQAGSE